MKIEKFNLQLPEVQKQYLEHVANELGTTMSSLVRTLIDKYLPQYYQEEEERIKKLLTNIQTKKSAKLA